MKGLNDSTASHSDFARRQRGYLNVALPQPAKLARLSTIDLHENRTINSRDHTHADGAIKSKTGVGTGDYEYPVQGPNSVRPHAVRSIPNVGSFTYDDNGNMLSDSSRTVSWNSFDMPKRISKGATYSEFVYGSEHQRVRQERSDGTTIVYAGAQEVETVAGKMTVKTYWPGGAGLEIEKTGLPIELVWTHADRLGSPIAISDATGNLKERLAYDAWGKRRSVLDGSAPNATDGVIYNRGFTNHEMLDQLDLVHMNGRVYDPFTARFMSGDPIIQDPTNGQNYNRYSYVFNNPTNLTDPTGFSAYTAEGCTGSRLCTETTEQKFQKWVSDFDKSLKGKTEEVKSAAYAQVGRIINKLTDNNSGDSKNSGGTDKRPTRYDKFSKWAHISLSGLGAIPAVGAIPDAVDLVFTAAEIPFGKSDGTDFGLGVAGLAATFAPVVGDGTAASLKIANRLGKACCCFPAGTPIATEFGLMPIEEVQVGQLVYSRDPITGQTELKPVTALMVTPTKPLFALVTKSKRGGVETTEVTDNHPYWVRNGGWIDSSALVPGMVLQSLDEGDLTVVSITKLPRSEVTYNFTVADFHTYFAGNQKAFVHNCSACKITLGGGADLSKLSPSEILRIQNATNKAGVPLSVVGSRVNPNKPLHANSDYDYVIDANNKIRSDLKSSLPGSKSIREGLPSRQDIFKGKVDPSLPHATFHPEP